MVEMERLVAGLLISGNNLGLIYWRNKLKNIGKLSLSFMLADDCVIIRRTD